MGRAADSRWSSAAAHRSGRDRVLDLEGWAQPAQLQEEEAQLTELRQCTYAGHPFGDDEFMRTMRERFGRTWPPGRPRKASAESRSNARNDSPLPLF